MSVPVILERCNIPIPTLLETPAIRTEIHSICQRHHADDSFLAWTAVTFRQLALLSSGSRLLQAVLEEIAGFLAELDLKQPVYLEDAYPYLKSPAWSVSMSRVSYIKVSAEKDGNCLFTIRAIEREDGAEEGALYLKLIPEETGSRIEGEKPVIVSFADECRLHQFMKKIILNGSADLEHDCDSADGEWEMQR